MVVETPARLIAKLNADPNQALTDVMANKLSQGGGMGLSKVIEQQLAPRGESAPPAATKGIL